MHRYLQHHVRPAQPWPWPPPRWPKPALSILNCRSPTMRIPSKPPCFILRPRRDGQFNHVWPQPRVCTGIEVTEGCVRLADGSPIPVVLMSHGLGGNYRVISWLAQDSG